MIILYSEFYKNAWNAYIMSECLKIILKFYSFYSWRIKLWKWQNLNRNFTYLQLHIFNGKINLLISIKYRLKSSSNGQAHTLVWVLITRLENSLRNNHYFSFYIDYMSLKLIITIVIAISWKIFDFK